MSNHRACSGLDAERARGQETRLIVTTDHGRDPSFVHHELSREASNVWLIAAGSMVRRRGVIELTQTRRLRDLVPSLRPLLGLSEDRSARAGSAITQLFPLPASR